MSGTQKEQPMRPENVLPVADGNAVVYCEGAFSSTYGKTAHGLVRFTRRYRVLSVIDSTLPTQDAGGYLDGKANGVNILPTLDAALEDARARGHQISYFVIGLAPDGGVLGAGVREAVRDALSRGLSVDSGLHEFIGDDPELTRIARKQRARIRDVRKTPGRLALHHFTGEIEQVGALRVAVLGTDSAVGKRTTAWILVRALEEAGYNAQLVGTGQTAWMQGARHSIILDSLINDFVSGEIEHAVVSAWKEERPDVIVIEGQGSLMNPAYPGGFEILAAGRPHAVILQHAPARKEYDGFPGYVLHPLDKQIAAITLLSGRKVVAVTVNHEGLTGDEIPAACARIEAETALPVCDPLVHGASRLVEVLRTQCGLDEPGSTRKPDQRGGP